MNNNNTNANSAYNKLITDLNSQKLCENGTLNSTLETRKGTKVNTVGVRVPAFNNALHSQFTDPLLMMMMMIKFTGADWLCTPALAK